MEDEKSFHRHQGLKSRKFHIGEALWDGIVYPLRKQKLARSFFFIFIYTISIYYVSYVLALTVYMLIYFATLYSPLLSNALNNSVHLSDIDNYGKMISEVLRVCLNLSYLSGYLPTRFDGLLDNHTFLNLQNVINYLFFIPIYGYNISVIQQSLKNNDIPPELINLKRLLTLGSKVSILYIIIEIFPQYAFKLESSVIYPSGLSKIVPQVSNSFEWAGPAEVGKFFHYYIDLQVMLVISWIVIPSLLVLYSRRGWVSDLLPLSQYKEIFKSVNYIQLIILTYLVIHFPDYLLLILQTIHFNDYLLLILQTIHLNDFYWFLFVIYPILKGSIFLYTFIMMNRILGKQWSKIQLNHSDRKLMCDTTVQKKIDSYFKR